MAPDPTLGKCLELDAARLVEPMRRVNQADDTILNEIADVDGMGHRGCNATGKLLDERETGSNARIDRTTLGAHECDLRRQVRQLQYQPLESAGIAVQPRVVSSPKWLFLQRLKAQIAQILRASPTWKSH